MLPSTNITTTLVGNELGVSTRDVGTLCTSDKVNMWSLAKPNFMVPDISLPDSFKKRSGGLLIPTYSALNVNELGILNNALWQYPKTYNIFRLGDFRGYNHNAFPPLTGVQVTPAATSNVKIGDKLKFYYYVSGMNPGSVYFNCGELTDLFLGVIITATKGSGTSEEGVPYPWDFTDEYRQYKIADYPFYNSQQGVIELNYIEVELLQTYNIKPGTRICCLLALFDSKNIKTARVTSLLLPAENPEDMFIADNIYQFNVIS